ncbi:hypothetical protein CCR75_005168 [Bremia lactucae]|uniref:Uncharacterized protein n=1 Tax=Bremia lactucae TaxID=4779 RepID=A0A976IEQ1_BRELC|nr:hypothetical protein CCR75_005168 [Bremia lactucae]
MTQETFSRSKFMDCCRNFALKSSKVHRHQGMQSVHLGKHLPAYSPFYNPIKVMFEMIKKSMQRNCTEGLVKARNMPAAISSMLGLFRNYSTNPFVNVDIHLRTI